MGFRPSPNRTAPVRTAAPAPRHAAPTGGAGRPLLRAGLAAALGLGVLGTGVTVSGAARSQACPPPLLDVVAAPQVAPAVAEVAAAQARATGQCPLATVRAADPAEVLRGLGEEHGHRPDVWVPDSSVWVDRADAAGIVLPARNPSLATSPVVLAVPSEAAAVPDGFAGYVAPQPPARIGLPSPRESATALGVLLAVGDAAAAQADPRLVSAGTLRAAVPQPAGGTLAERLARAGGLAVPATEQEVTALNAGTPGSAAALAPAAGAVLLDHPWVVLSGEAATARAAEALLATLTGQGRELLLAAGFGAPVPGPATAATGGRQVAGVPSRAEAESAVRALEAVLAPSRMLAVLDVSGSMGLPVPGTGGATRIDLARAGAVGGLAFYPDDTVVGLWAFSTDLTPGSDHVEVVPLTPLGPAAGGTSGRDRLLSAVRDLRHVPGGDTGLYDTALAAVRAVRAGYDPARVNSVVLLSDGRNDDDEGIGREELLETLEREADPVRPVPVITIAYGPDGDAEAMAAISAVTGGASYLSEDPRQIRQVVLDAIGQRPCRPRC